MFIHFIAAWEWLLKLSFNHQDSMSLCQCPMQQGKDRCTSVISRIYSVGSDGGGMLVHCETLQCRCCQGSDKRNGSWGRRGLRGEGRKGERGGRGRANFKQQAQNSGKSGPWMIVSLPGPYLATAQWASPYNNGPPSCSTSLESLSKDRACKADGV